MRPVRGQRTDWLHTTRDVLTVTVLLLTAVILAGMIAFGVAAATVLHRAVTPQPTPTCTAAVDPVTGRLVCD